MGAEKTVIERQFFRTLSVKACLRNAETECGTVKEKYGVAVVLAMMIGMMICWGMYLPETEKAAAEMGTAVSVETPSLSAGAAVLMDGEDGRILYQLNGNQKMYPASTTKIMTALTALKICEELDLGLDSEILVPPEAIGVEGSSIYLKEGERISLEELLYGMMLQSGNDAAVAVAASLGGNMESFLERMNEEAQDLGCSGTHFVNPHGLPDPEHYTTAADLAFISREALRDVDFQRIVSTKEWNSTAASDGGRTFVNKNKTLFQYDGGDGVKIGYTKASGRTLVASATRDGRQLIAVVLNDGNWFQDAYRLLDYGFEIMEGEGGNP